MLLKDFYYLEELKESEERKNLYKGIIVLNQEHEIYRGHFPGNPIVPGVCLIQIIKEIVERIELKEVRMVKSDNIKFLNFIDPKLNARLEIEVTLDKSLALKVKSVFSFEEKIFLKFSGVFQE